MIVRYNPPSPILRLALARKWFLLVAKGEKRFELRDDKPYWEQRFYRFMKGGGVAEFALGYPARGDKKRRHRRRIESIHRRTEAEILKMPAAVQEAWEFIGKPARVFYIALGEEVK